MSIHRLFLDANVLFSAAYRPDNGLLQLSALSDVELVTSTYAVDEAHVNLASETQWRRLDELVNRMRLSVGIAQLPSGLVLPHKDQPILQAAIYARATHLLTGDKSHFGRDFGRTVAGVLILPPSDYLRPREVRDRRRS